MVFLGLPIRTSHAVSSTTVEPVALETSLPPQLGLVVPMDYKRVQEQKEKENRQAEIAKSNQKAALLSVDCAYTKTQTLSMDMRIAPTAKSPLKTVSPKRSVLLPPKIVFNKNLKTLEDTQPLLATSRKILAPTSRNLMLHEHRGMKLLENYDEKVPSFARTAATKTVGKDYVVKAQVLFESRAEGRFSSGLQEGGQTVFTPNELKEKTAKWLGVNLVTNQTDKREKKFEEILTVRRLHSVWKYSVSVTVNKHGPIVIASSQGGVVKNLDAIVKVPIDVNVGITPQVASTIAKTMALSDQYEVEVRKIVEKLYEEYKNSIAMTDGKPAMTENESRTVDWTQECYSDQNPQTITELMKQAEEVAIMMVMQYKKNIEKHIEADNLKNIHSIVDKLTISKKCKAIACIAFQNRYKNNNQDRDFEDIRSNIREQAASCMDCGNQFCQGHSGCLLAKIIPKWNDYVFKTNWRQALEQLMQTNSFPEFTGTACPAPCEVACCLGIGSPEIFKKSVDGAIIDYVYMQKWMQPHKPNFNTGKKVAIIGSGPSGLAAAAELTKVGHSVCVYEKNDRCGGLLRYGIPTMKLETFAIDDHLQLLEREGVRFLTNTQIGKHVPADFLLKENDAVIVCTGSTTARDLTVEGRDAKGICFAMEFLEKSQRRRAGDEIAWEGLDPTGKKVIVLGDGDTATDCIATSNRLGCQTVGVFEILSQPSEGREPEHPLPECPLIFRTDYEHEEAKVLTGSDPRTYSVSIKRFLTTTNSAGVKVLTGLEIVNVEWEKDEKGAWKLVEKTDTLRVIEADLCILAMGFELENRSTLNLKTDPHSNILTSTDKYDSAVAKVFAAGDCRRGQSLVLWAIHEGRQAARQVDDYLMGNTTLAGLGGNVTSNIVHK